MDGTWLLVVGGWTDVMMKIRHQRKSQLHITVLQLSVFEGTIARGLTITQTISDRTNQTMLNFPRIPNVQLGP